MNGKEFISSSEAMTNILSIMQKIFRDRRVLPDVEPGYIRDLLPNHLPEEPQKFEAIMEDIEKIIMPGIQSFL
ncbi:hypothetical protein Anas_09392 [Armadillidium nasatum]|uniref:Uncharacterized protein n=1 Tax=Armadillidium nasatum TaxID=96803 RepID=A0A5N5T691_9CRUS|nr:hypothetical protein Anas_09392 [Armadillidium nasatum]